jgi:hypothetical protein
MITMMLMKIIIMAWNCNGRYLLRMMPMKTLATKLIVFAVAVNVLVAMALGTCFTQRAFATSMLIPGETEEEVVINAGILKSTDEASILQYLNHTAESVRMTACMKLGEIGSHSALGLLEGKITDPDEAYSVRDAAALSFWKIAYRQELQTGGNTGELLLSVFDEGHAPLVTLQVKGWALDLLGDRGVTEAVSIIEEILGDEKTSTYLKEKATLAQIKISFIMGFPPDATIEQKIADGLDHQELCVRMLALKWLCEQRYEDIIERLSALYEAKKAAGDTPFAAAVAHALKEERELTRYYDFQILFPEDGATVQAPDTVLEWYANGKVHTEYKELQPGVNTFTVTATDRDGALLEKSVTVHFENQPPVLASIADQEIPAGEPFTLQATVTDPDDSLFIFFAYGAPEGAAMDAETGTFTWPNPQPGSYTIKVAVEDGYLVDSQEVTIVVAGETGGGGDETGEDPYDDDGYGDDTGYDDGGYEDPYGDTGYDGGTSDEGSNESGYDGYTEDYGYEEGYYE